MLPTAFRSILFRTLSYGVLTAVLLSGFLAFSVRKVQSPSPLKVTADGHYLVQEDGQPFFWLGDTAWRLFAMLDRSEATRYLKDRAEKRFTVVQAHLLDWEFNAANANGDQPFNEGDFTRPNEAYWQHVDYIIEEAARQEVYMALLPIWARAHIEPHQGDATGKVLYRDTLSAYHYGRFLGKRYQHHNNIIWILGGDAWGTRDTVYRHLAQGLADGAAGGDQDNILMSFHPKGGTYRPPATSTGEFYHAQLWLDFNMIQSGHRVGNKNYERIQEDYRRRPTKPTLDSEPCYEQHPIEHKFAQGVFGAWHLRRRAYWSLLAGACGFTYGGNGLWQMDKPGQVFKPSHHNYFWYDALDHAGAHNMAHVRALFESRPFLDPERIPDQQILLSDEGTVDDRVQCARAADNSYWIIYSTNGRNVTVDLSKVSGEQCAAWWYNPRDGKLYNAAGERTRRAFATMETEGEWVFTPPGEEQAENDWILVLDDRDKFYPRPGRLL